MEPGVRVFLTRILNTIFLVLFWLAINSTAGIMFEYAFIQDHIGVGNIIFYGWLLLSFAILLRWVLRTWSKPIDFDEP